MILLQKRMGQASFQHPSMDAKHNSQDILCITLLSIIFTKWTFNGIWSQTPLNDIDTLVTCTFVTNNFKQARTLHLWILTSHSSHSIEVTNEDNFINHFYTLYTFCEVHYFYFPPWHKSLLPKVLAQCVLSSCQYTSIHSLPPIGYKDLEVQWL